ncbi:hypothetical protein CMV_030452, partial [Castanea mollissima]
FFTLCLSSSSSSSSSSSVFLSISFTSNPEKQQPHLYLLIASHRYNSTTATQPRNPLKMRVCLRRPLHSTLLFSSSSTTRTSITSPSRLGRVWSQRSLSHVSVSASASATTLRSFKLPTTPGHTKSQSWMMGSKNMFKTNSFAIPFANSSHRHSYNTHTPLFSAFSSKPISKIHSLPLQTNGFSSISHANVPGPDILESPAEYRLETTQLKILKRKLEELGMDTEICVPGQYNHLLCPMCKGGDSEEKSLSLFVTEDGDAALWMCFRGKCGWRGSTRASADSRSLSGSLNPITKVKIQREITVENLQLEPLCDQIIGYFAERLISRETLQRNSVMQKSYAGDQLVIAFTYWKHGKLVSCKYRDSNKKFWQEANTEKIFYGLDDIKDKSDIIIVEGEMDKLAMEEAGFRNCVSVPDGAPAVISTKELPPEEKDIKYQYLWNCKEYLQKASRIVLATDGDTAGQALAEELARRLGRERCWRVKWPKKNKVDHCKDANEVLMFLGADVLKEVIDKAELFPIRGLFNFKNYFEEIDAYYNRTYGYEFGLPTGWRALNEFYNVSKNLHF